MACRNYLLVVQVRNGTEREKKQGTGGERKRKTCGAIVMHTIHRLKQVRAAGISIWISEPRLATGFLGRESGRWCKGEKRQRGSASIDAVKMFACHVLSLREEWMDGWIEGVSK